MKRNHSQTRTFLMGMVTMLLLVSLSVTALAAYNQNMTVTYSDIKINVNGTQITPKDATGRVVEPFIYEGTTYLPVRATADAVGYNVSWDQTTKTVYLTNGGGSSSSGNSGNSGGNQGGNSQAQGVKMIDTLGAPYASDGYSSGIVTYPSTGSKSVAMGGVAYKNAISVNTQQYDPSSVSYNLSGKYRTLGGMIGIMDNSINGYGKKEPIAVTFYGDGTLLKTIEVPLDGLPTSFSIDVSGVSALKIEYAANFDTPDVTLADLILS